MRKYIRKGQEGIPDIGYYTPWSGVGDITQREYFLMNGDGAEMFHRNQDEMMRATASLNGSPAPVAGIIGRTPEQIRQQALTDTMNAAGEKLKSPSTNFNFGQFIGSVGKLFDNGSFGQWAAHTIMDVIPGEQKSNELQSTTTGLEETALNAWIPGLGTALNLGRQGLEKAGLTNDNMNLDTANRLGLNAGFNNFVKHGIVGDIISGLAGKNTNDYSVSDSAMSGQGAFSGTINRLQDIEEVTGKRYGRRLANQVEDRRNEAIRTDNTISDLMETSTLRKNNDILGELQSNLTRKMNGIQGYTRAKEGMKLASAEDMRKLLSSRKSPVKMQNGGEIPGVDNSIIPDGKLHKELNHLEDTPLDAEVTKKGIPVVQVTENGDLEQIAEIEKEELVLTKALTDQIETLMEDGSDEAAIQAGILLSNELIENTKDFTGKLIEENGDTNS